MDGGISGWLFPLAFGAIFALFWLAVTQLLLVLSGWTNLAARMPDRADTVLETLRFQSGNMGDFFIGGVSFRGCLTLEVSMTGLRVRIRKIFAPFSGPIFIPWNEIEVRHRHLIFIPNYDLIFGTPKAGNLMVSRRTGRHIVEASQGALVLPN